MAWHVNDRGDLLKFTVEREDDAPWPLPDRLIVGRERGLYDPSKCFATWLAAEAESRRNRAARVRMAEEVLRETAATEDR